MSNVDPEIGRSIVAAGLKTNYLDAGEGQPVVLIHGSGPGVTAYANWRLTIPVLARKFRVLAPDMAGFGYTERRAGQRYDLDVWLRHLTDWMDAVGVPIPRGHQQRMMCVRCTERSDHRIDAFVVDEVVVRGR